jgi:hypothetical protein
MYPGIDFVEDNVKDPAVRRLVKDIIELVLNFREHWNTMDGYSQSMDFLQLDT